MRASRLLEDEHLALATRAWPVREGRSHVRHDPGNLGREIGLSSPRLPSSPDLLTFPRLNAYLRALPAGLASHPEAETKASLLVGALEDKPLAEYASRLPAELAAVVTQPLLVSTWMSAVLAQAMFLAIADAHALTDDAFESWSRATQLTLLRRPLYRALAVVASPAILLQGAERRWRSFHRGSVISVAAQSPAHVHIALEHPTNLYAPTNLRGFAGGFAAVAELAGGRAVRVKVGARTATRSEFEVVWAT